MAREWEAANRDRVRERNRVANAKRMTVLREIIDAAKSQPCVECGVTLPPACMDLDHVRGQKRRTVGNGSGFGVETLRAEIAKCEVRCPNCHRLRHYYERTV